MFLKNEIVYLEGKTDDKIYVIYTGMFKLQKMNKSSNDIDILTHKDEVGTTILLLVRDDISGLEACRNESYRFTLQVFSFVT
jgi:hypothetical protein